MQRASRLLTLVLAGVLFGPGCSFQSPDAGHEVVLVQKPLIWGHGGVDPEPVKTGLTFTALTTQGVDVNMQPLRLDLAFDDLMTSSGVPIDFHAVVSCQVTDSVKLVKDFGNDYLNYPDNSTVPGWFFRNLEQPFRTAVRDSVKKRDMNSMAITATAAEEVDAEVTAHLQALIKESGVPVVCRDLSLGRANPPDAVKNQRVETATQEQRAITEGLRKKAEDQRLQAEQSRANADNAYRESMHLSPEQFIQLEAIKMQVQVCGKDGKGNCTFIQNGVSRFTT